MSFSPNFSNSTSIPTPAIAQSGAVEYSDISFFESVLIVLFLILAVNLAALACLYKRNKAELSAIDSAATVSYTHLTLPTT